MQTELRAGWTLIERGLANRERDRGNSDGHMDRTEWGAIGIFCTPNTCERAKSMGMAAYLSSLRQLGLDDYRMFHAKGNSFDRAGIMLQLRDALAA